MIGRITGRLAEKNPPQILVDVNGVGYELEVPMSTIYGLPATGQAVSLSTHLAVLSGLSVADLAQAITLQESGRLVKIPGIGKKTAERLLLELRDKLAKALPAVAGNVSTNLPGNDRSDIMNALLALGYNEKEALGATKALPEGVSVSDGIRQALKGLSKA